MRAISTTWRCELSSSFFFFLQGKEPKEIHAILTETLQEHAPSYAIVKNWVAQFKRGDFLATQKKLAYLSFQCLDQPPYSPHLTPSDYHLFSGLKKQLKDCHFSSYAEVIAAAETWLGGQYSEFFFEWLAKVRATG